MSEILDILGAGLPRTGTTSLREALAIIGYGPCYHMRDCFEQNDIQLWINVQKDLQSGKKADFGSILSRKEKIFRSAIDYPPVSFFEELREQCPSAKVILTIRDSPEAWVESFMSTVGGAEWHRTIWRLSLFTFHFVAIRRFMAAIGAESRTGSLEWGSQDRSKYMQYYSEWNEKIKKTIPAKQLLVFNVKQGWKPLCDFLGVPVPDHPFPNVNSKAEMQLALKTVGFFSFLPFVGAAVAVGAGTWFAYKSSSRQP